MPKLSHYRKKADKAMQEFFRGKYKCESCGKSSSCMHHFFPKSVASSLRYDIQNLIPLCAGCHLRHHNGDPRIHAKVLEDRGQEWYNDLLSRKEQIIKLNQGYYKEIINKYNN